MDRPEKKLSPLEALVAYQQAQSSPTKATPKDRFEKAEKIDRNIIIPTVEDSLTVTNNNLSNKNLVITNSSLVMNFNLNIDPEMLDLALEKSKQVAKSVFAAGAAMMGTAFFFSGNDKKPAKVKMPLMPKVKLPKIK